MSKKPSIPKGTRDFNPTEVAKRNYIMKTIQTQFELFGFQPIETPSFENSDTLMGKYGEEGDRLIFKILNSGDYYSTNEKNFKLISDLTQNATTFFREFFFILKNASLNTYDYKVIVEFIEKNLKTISLQISCNSSQEERKIFQNYILNQKNTIALKIVNIVGSFFENENTFLNFIDLELPTIINKSLKKTIDKLITNEISEKALRYDLTVPFARYVVQHQNEIEFPFKRYQMQPVWRADRPQKGRFREFYQCDADVVGSTSLWQEVAFVQLYDTVFTTLGLEGVTIKMNNRKILAGIAEVIGAQDKLIDFTVALDKLDKIGADGVKNEMIQKGIDALAIEKMQPLFDFKGNLEEKISQLEALLVNSKEGTAGVQELDFITKQIVALGLSTAVLDIDVTLARGLNYYTGAIFEVQAPKVAMGSIGGGGRYDDLTGIFGLKNMSGVGISFGLDRIYLVLEELDLFPKTVMNSVQALFLNFGPNESLYAMKAIQKLRAAGINSELYPDATKIGKQFQHADKRGIKFAVLVGETEIQNNQFSLKNLVDGQQETVSLETLIARVQG
uniref:histidine--tRNA ligase n=2 Tax=Flavobacterium sp. TaxID=239 RepID=UPI0040496A91